MASQQGWNGLDVRFFSRMANLAGVRPGFCGR
jgi:hypothetical protein